MARRKQLRRPELEADRLGQAPEFIQRSLTAAAEREHEQVEAGLTGGRLVGDELLDEEDPSVGGERSRGNAAG